MVLNLMDPVKNFWKRPDSDPDPQQCDPRMVLILMDLEKIFQKRPDPDSSPQQCDLEFWQFSQPSTSNAVVSMKGIL
jgi:hypothetical protein